MAPLTGKPSPASNRAGKLMSPPFVSHDRFTRSGTSDMRSAIADTDQVAQKSSYRQGFPRTRARVSDHVTRWRYCPPGPVLSPVAPMRRAATARLPFPLNAPTTRYYVARNGIYHLFRALGADGQDVLVPNYHSGNEVWAIRAAGATLRYYSIDRNLAPDLDQVERLARSGGRFLYVIHFVGWPQPIPQLLELCGRYGMVLVEDCALSFLSEYKSKPLGTFGDYAIYCLYKTLPIPNGGILVENGKPLPRLKSAPLERCSRLSVAGRTAELMVAWLRSRSEGIGRRLASAKSAVGRALTKAQITRLPVGDIGFNLNHVNIAMSRMSEHLLRRFDYDSIRVVRRRNYARLHQKLSSRATLLFDRLPDGVCPLFFPILVPNKHQAALALLRRGIEATELWNTGDPGVPAEQSADARFLRKHVLELPIHQDIADHQIDYIADQVLGLRLHF